MNRIKTVLCLGLSLICWLGIVFLPLPAQAVTLGFMPQTLVLQTSSPPSLEELQRQQESVERDRSNVVKERDRLRNLEQTVYQNLGGLEFNIRATDVQIKDYEFQLKLAEDNLKRLQQDLIAAEKAYQDRQFATVARLRFLQRQQGNQGWAVLLQSQDLNQFLDRRYQLKRLYTADQQILTQLKAEAASLQDQRLQVEQQKNQIALMSQQLLAQKSQFQAQAQSQQKLVSRLRQDRTALEAAEAQLARDSAGLSDLIQKRVSEQRAAEAEKAREQNRSSVVVRGTGRFTYPSAGPITSNFGWRVHPVLGTRRFHAGTDFGDDYGSPIRAADTGTVIFSGWYGGYGNTVILEHGGGITTLYAHASELYVSEGDVVQRGQTIAAIGSTGLSTGPHLHFEVRQDGEPVEPMDYLS